MNTLLPEYSENLLNEFAEKEWKKVLSYLKRTFSLSTEDCEDVFQESFIVLLIKSKQGDIKDYSSSLSTYFLRICINKSYELLKSKYNKTFDKSVDIDILPQTKKEKIAELIALDSDVEKIEEKEAKARQIVSCLPHPCDKLLWGFYRDNLSIRALAALLGKTENYIKVTKSRCQKKFRLRWQHCCDADSASSTR